MGLPDSLKVHFFLIPMMYVLCLVGFCPAILDIWLTSAIFTVEINLKVMTWAFEEN